jgi:hypothetical protein
MSKPIAQSGDCGLRATLAVTTLWPSRTVRKSCLVNRRPNGRELFRGDRARYLACPARILAADVALSERLVRSNTTSRSVELFCKPVVRKLIRTQGESHGKTDRSREAQ